MRGLDDWLSRGHERLDDDLEEREDFPYSDPDDAYRGPEYDVVRGEDSPVQSLFNAREHVKDDWRSYALLTNAIVAYYFDCSDDSVKAFARAICR